MVTNMSQTATLEEVREVFAKDRFATENGSIIEEVGEHYAKCSIELTERHQNAVGAIMGGVHCVLADFAFAVASNWAKMEMVSLNSSISYLGAVKGHKLIAEARCIKNGRTTAFYTVELKDELENEVAIVTITGFRK